MYVGNVTIDAFECVALLLRYSYVVNIEGKEKRYSLLYLFLVVVTIHTAYKLAKSEERNKCVIPRGNLLIWYLWHRTYPPPYPGAYV